MTKDELEARKAELRQQMIDAANSDRTDLLNGIYTEYTAVKAELKKLEKTEETK